MYLQVREKHRLTSKMQLTKSVREQYTHSGLAVLPSSFSFDKTVLIADSDIVRDYRALFLTDVYHFIVCASVLDGLPEDTRKNLDRSGCKYTFFDDQACTETANKGLDAVLSYARARYPSGAFEVVGADNLAECLRPFPEAADILHSVAIREQLRSGAPHFAEYHENLEYLHRAGTLVRGSLIMSSVDSTVGEVLSTNSRIRVSGAQLNRALHGDEVYVEGDAIVGIYKRKMRTIVGTLYRVEDTCSYIRPVDRRLPDFIASAGFSEECVGLKVSAYFVDWPATSPLPAAVVFKMLGRTGDIESEVAAIARHYSIDYYGDSWTSTLNRRRAEIGQEPFFGESCAVEDAACPSAKKSKTSADPAERTPGGLGFDSDEFSVGAAYREMEAGRRTDLRHLDVCSIDPIGCTDIDDALHCVEAGDLIEVGVHIADVSLYVKPDSILDREARHRSTTVYFPDRRIDMLPAFLSADLCSLRQNEDRAAFSCIWTLDRNFQIVETKIMRSVIRSRASLSYEQAYAVLQGLPNAVPAACADSIVMLMKIADKLRRDRFDKGALELNAQEVYVNAEKKVCVKDSIPTHYLVEEFMLLANISVAQYMYRYNPEYSLLRKHPLPSAIDLDGIDCSSSKTINESLARVDPQNRIIMKRIITKSMQQAVYFASGEASDFYHYGLATDIYTHFTSPIRRYPDVVVHRILAYIINHDESALDGLSASVTSRACSTMNFRHRNAQYASRMVTALYLYTALDETPMEASIVCKRDAGYVIFIRAYGIEEYIATDRDYKTFDKITVQLRKNLTEYCTTWKMNLDIID
ncbi:exosome complex exonuclease DIS3/RRP44 [Pancytospora philotis]|nr:exosome complex exonuclease DIS3/RRP44 [Pancytospora philotis]